MQLKQFPILTSERLILDELKNSDRDDIFAIFSNPEVIAHYDVELFKDISEADNLIKYFRSRYNANNGVRWAVRKQGAEDLIGSVGFTAWNEYDYSAIIGYDLHPNHWGKGYASEAVNCILQYAFGERFPFKVNRIESIIMPSNLPSIAVSEKAGFKLEGTLREKVFLNGQFIDMQLYSLLRREWEEDN